MFSNVFNRIFPGMLGKEGDKKGKHQAYTHTYSIHSQHSANKRNVSIFSYLKKIYILCLVAFGFVFFSFLQLRGKPFQTKIFFRCGQMRAVCLPSHNQYVAKYSPKTEHFKFSDFFFHFSAKCFYLVVGGHLEF